MSGFGQRRPCQRMESMHPAVASVFWRHRRTQDDDCGRNFKGPIEGSPLCCPLRFSANSSSIIPSYDPLPVVSISEVNGDGFVSRGPVASSSLGWASHLGSMSRFRPAPDGLVTAADGQKRAKLRRSDRVWRLGTGWTYRPSKRAVDRYRSAKEGIIVTIILPAKSSRVAT